MSEHPTSPTAFSGLFKKETKVEEDWIEWDGFPLNGPPIYNYVLVEVQHKDGQIKRGRVEEFDWYHWYMESDIIAYRVVSPKPDLGEVSEYLRNNDWKEAGNKYLRPFPYDTIDIYRVLQVYEVTDPCIQHAVKKLLCAGQRGYKEVEKDVQEAIQSLQRWEEMRREETLPF